MSVYQYHPDNLYSFASADGHINPSNATHAVSNALPMPGGSIGTNVISNQGGSNERTDSLQQIDHEVFKKKYFTDISVIDGKKYRFCKNVALNRCKDTRQGAQKGRYSSSTSGSILKRHVEVCLGIIFDGEKTPKRDLKQTPASSKKRHNENLFLDGGDKRPKKDTKSATSPVKKGHNENLAHVIVENMLPMSLVNSASFKRFCAGLNYKPPDRRTMSNLIVKMYLSELQSFQASLHRTTSHVSWTCDSWTSTASLPFIAFTIHFIDNNWKKVDKMLAFRLLPYPHTAAQYRETLRAMSTEWGLVGKLNAGITDNEAAMTAGNEEFATFDLPHQTALNYHPMRCTIHILQLPIKSAFKNLATQLAKARAISSLVHTSPKFGQFLKRECEKLEVEKYSESMDSYKGPVELQTDCETRWNSTLVMLKLLMRMRKPLQALGITISQASRREARAWSEKMLTDKDWADVFWTIYLLEDFQEITDFLGAQRYPTLSSTFGAFENAIEQLSVFDRTLATWRVQNAAKGLHEQLCDPSGWVDQIAATIQADLAGRLRDLRERNTLVELALMVDPRFRLNGISEVNHAHLKDKLATYLDLIAPAPPATTPTANVFIGSQQSLGTYQASTLPSLPKKQKFMKRAFCEQDSGHTFDEIERWFLQEPEAEDIDPIPWFKARADLYPRIAVAARNLLAIPATSVPSERLFSITDSIISKKRCNLSSKVVQATLCLRDWGYGMPEVHELDDDDLTEEMATEWQTVMHQAPA